MKIILVSHGNFAKGLYDTVTTFFGAQNVDYANVDLETGTTGLVEKVTKLLESYGQEQVVICSDLKGGSANQTSVQFITRPNTYLVSGMNLALVLQLMMLESVDSDGIKNIIEESKNDIVLVNEALSANVMDEDDE